MDPAWSCLQSDKASCVDEAPKARARRLLPARESVTDRIVQRRLLKNITSSPLTSVSSSSGCKSSNLTSTVTKSTSRLRTVVEGEPNILGSDLGTTDAVEGEGYIPGVDPGAMDAESDRSSSLFSSPEESEDNGYIDSGGSLSSKPSSPQSRPIPDTIPWNTSEIDEGIEHTSVMAIVRRLERLEERVFGMSSPADGDAPAQRRRKKKGGGKKPNIVLTKAFLKELKVRLTGEDGGSNLQLDWSLPVKEHERVILDILNHFIKHDESVRSHVGTMKGGHAPAVDVWGQGSNDF
ncbi:uncharacterized protein SRS1_25036 [Sporisorium reilianum f. sp. reilianum]|uniref:Uncharacterized protein n=1 Tax=Sporisorium reilianum f. sp. reilianum TaxID=72559 RepID=A0A2N8UBG6_9BASI|nr:uncharacterized protein SRS1_25036 [Sporisorium reilianum f. sp. reilianum]